MDMFYRRCRGMQWMRWMISSKGWYSMVGGKCQKSLCIFPFFACFAVNMAVISYVAPCNARLEAAASCLCIDIYSISHSHHKKSPHRHKPLTNCRRSDRFGEKQENRISLEKKI